MMLMAEITWLRSLQSQPKLASDGIIHTESIDWYRFVVDIMWERSKLIYWYTEISLWAMNNVRKNRKIDGVVKERKCSCWVVSNFCDPKHYSLLCSSVRGIFQARILEWFNISSSRGSSWSRNWTCILCLLYWQGDSLLLYYPGSLYNLIFLV